MYHNILGHLEFSATCIFLGGGWLLRTYRYSWICEITFKKKHGPLLSIFL